MKLYRGEYEDGSVLCFNEEPLVCNNPFLFEYLVNIQNERFEQLNKISESAEMFFNKPMPRIGERVKEPKVVKIADCDI